MMSSVSYSTKNFFAGMLILIILGLFMHSKREVTASANCR